MSASQVNLGRRFMWWAPWKTTRPWRLWVWTGANEWCQRSVCLDLPFLGTFIVFWERTLRTMPCDKDWALMDDEQRADYLPGGIYHGGRVHERA